MPAPKLLTRDSFRAAVFARDQHRCVNCGAEGVPLDAHHLVERRLWPDGGYYLDNGATLCDPTCHMLAESTELSCDDIRAKCGIKSAMLPPHLYPGDAVDKWGNVILPNGLRLRGELFWDESVRLVLLPVAHLFTRLVKPPRTMHLPWSTGRTKDDRALPDVEFFRGKRVVVTEKLDGENTSVWGADGYVHARTVDPLAPHPSRDRMKALAAELGPDIPVDWRVTGENIAAVHSIRYENLPPHPRWFFRPFNVWNERNECLAWGDVEEWCSLLDLQPVPVLYDGTFDEGVIRSLASTTRNGDPSEGYVVRLYEGFPFRDYRRAVGKFVRANHNHSHGWRHQRVEFNRTSSSA
jgi:hypothetical protein